MNKHLKNLEKQANKMFVNVGDWEINALRRIGTRVKKIGSLSYADLQAINNATIVNQDIEKVLKELAELTGQNVRYVRKMYAEMIEAQHEDNKYLYDYRNKPFIPFAENKELQAITEAFARTTSETFVNLSMTKAKDIGFVDELGQFQSMDIAWQNTIDKAVMSVSTGTGDFNSEMLDVLRMLGGSGIRVNYGNNITRSLDSMVRQNVLWGAKQTFKAYENIIGDELGCDGIEIDWHLYPRPSHEFMQGKQYILGKARTVNGIYYESADKALDALNDYGCLHFETRIICGVSEPAYSEEEIKRLNEESNRQIEIDGVTKTGYEWKQAMRRLERGAKQTKLQRETFKAQGNNVEARNQSQKLKAIQEKYNLIANKTGIKAQYERMAIVKGKGIDKSVKSGIIKEERAIGSREMANGMRTSPNHILSDDEIKSLKGDIKAINADESIFEFNRGRYTGYNDKTDKIKIRGDVLPEVNSQHPRDLMSSKAVIAHEYYGHRAYRGTKLKKGSWNDEFRASYMAAKNTPNLSEEDRRYLVLDALERAKESGIAIKNNDFIRRILYGY